MAQVTESNWYSLWTITTCLEVGFSTAIIRENMTIWVCSIGNQLQICNIYLKVVVNLFITVLQYHRNSIQGKIMRLKLIRTTVSLCFLIISVVGLNIPSLSTLAPIKAKAEPKICDGNRFKHISTYALGKQNDLNLTFNTMQRQTHVEKVVYKDELFRTYTIFPLTLDFAYSEGSQTATTIGADRIKVTGGSLRIGYSFNWEKKQLSGSIEGTGKGAVRTDPITFIKSLNINSQTKQFEWNFVSAEPIKITNSLTVSQIKPYKAADYDVINEMLNELKSGQPTVKTKLLAAINANFSKILAKFVHQNNDTWKQPQKIFYTYTDEHGSFEVTYDNIMLNSSLAQGLDLLLSQSIQNDPKFQCGEKVPTQPQDEKIYGGLQQYISNTLIKSTLRNAVNKGFLDVVLTEQFWQSPAFQFYMGDVHDVIPSTKNISSLEPITGKCKALDDKVFSLDMKTTSTYTASVNFTCDLKFSNNTKRLVSLNIAVSFEAKVVANVNTIDFVIKGISGTPTFFQEEEYKIKNMELALYMVQETLKMTLNAKVLGSGFKVLGKKYPRAEVRPKYLFLFDMATKMEQQPKVNREPTKKRRAILPKRNQKPQIYQQHML